MEILDGFRVYSLTLNLSLIYFQECSLYEDRNITFLSYCERGGQGKENEDTKKIILQVMFQGRH